MKTVAASASHCDGWALATAQQNDTTAVIKASIFNYGLH
ncbi:hypothetical protein CAter282_4450 [Collimonas arenae]|uniref:Uncharacterized protein n=1 Tax=Collimonas arenae TaxID=279058 RepID=A0A127QPR1_9BURK|nr:hypothetical protein CAter282_4450 [Collimonas arenae]